MSVQTLFFGEHHYHRGGVPYPGMNVGKITGNEYFEFRIATLRHAIVAVLKQGRALLLQAAENKAAGGGDGDADAEGAGGRGGLGDTRQGKAEKADEAGE